VSDQGVRPIKIMRDRLVKNTETFLRRAGAQWQGAMTRRFGRDRDMTSRSGKLVGSLNYAFSGFTLGDMQLKCYSAGVPYALSHEFGARIRPVKAKWLTIPGPDNLTAAGVPREPSMRAFMERIKPFGRLRIFPSHRKQGTLLAVFYPNAVQRAIATGADRRRLRKAEKSNVRGQLMWILKKQVTIPGPKTTGASSSLRFFETWQDIAPAREALREKFLSASAIWGKS